jgi:hypothetical protein
MGMMHSQLQYEIASGLVIVMNDIGEILEDALRKLMAKRTLNMEITVL